jgi:hypothetical protein
MSIRELLAMLLLACGGVAAAAELAQGTVKHLGVATCASSVCHGKLTAQSGRDVALNEYQIWSHDDYHSRAYRDLINPQSQAIAAKLGLASAATSKLCLDCHADNVPATLRGPKFQLTDGVQCEACHGGAEKWIETHAQKGVPHSDNVARGTVPVVPHGHARQVRDPHDHGRRASAPAIRITGLYFQPAGACPDRRRLCAAQGPDR